jgi:hypothetical protein
MHWAVAVRSVLLIASGVQEAAAFLPAAIFYARQPSSMVARAAITSTDTQIEHLPEGDEDAQLKLRSESEQEYLENFCWLSAIIGPETTGMPMVIYVSPKHAPHGPQIKVNQRYEGRLVAGECFSVTIEDEPLILGETGDIRVSGLCKLRSFIQINKELLLDYWDSIDEEEPMSAFDMIDSLQKV